MILLKIDTILLDKFSPIITLIIVLFMVFVVGRCLLSKDVAKAVLSLLICGLMLWAVNNLSSFMIFITNVVTFFGSVFGMK